MSIKDLGLVTAYGYAVAGGFTGSEAEFKALLGNVAVDLDVIEHLSADAETLEPGSSATASYSNGVVSFGIPKGDPGELVIAENGLLVDDDGFFYINL